MKRSFKALFIFTLVLAGAALAAQDLQVYYFPRPPLYTKNADGSVGGFMSEIAKLVLAEAKVPYKWVEMPSARVEPSLKNKDFATGLGWFKNPSREEWANFSEPLYQELPLVAVVVKAKAAALGSDATIDKLLGSGLTLGTIQGFSYGAFADQAIARLKPKTEAIVGEQTTLVQMVAKGRADLLLLGLEEAGYLLENDKSSAGALQIVKISDAPAGNSRYFMFSKAVDKSILDRVNAALAKIKATDNYRKLTDFSRYLKK